MFGGGCGREAQPRCCINCHLSLHVSLSTDEKNKKARYFVQSFISNVRCSSKLYPDEDLQSYPVCLTIVASS